MNESKKPNGHADDLSGFFGEPIHSYTRQQAIGDGVLVDMTEQFADLVRNAGFR